MKTSLAISIFPCLAISLLNINFASAAPSGGKDKGKRIFLYGDVQSGSQNNPTYGIDIALGRWITIGVIGGSFSYGTKDGYQSLSANSGVGPRLNIYLGKPAIGTAFVLSGYHIAYNVADARYAVVKQTSYAHRGTYTGNVYNISESTGLAGLHLQLGPLGVRLMAGAQHWNIPNMVLTGIAGPTRAKTTLNTNTTIDPTGPAAEVAVGLAF